MFENEASLINATETAKVTSTNSLQSERIISQVLAATTSIFFDAAAADVFALFRKCTSLLLSFLLFSL